MRTPGSRLRDRLERTAERRVVGRERELASLEGLLTAEDAVLAFVHGVGGIGKSALLGALAPRLRLRGARVVELDGRTIEPTPRGFLGALASALEVALPADESDALEGLAAAVERERAATAVIVDEIDRLRLLDDWLRRSLLPALPERTRWVFAGRFAPRPEWLTAPGWADAVTSLRLGTLTDADSNALLRELGVGDDDVASMLGVARGSPLALTLLARRARADDLESGLGDSAVLAVLAERFVDDLSPELRQAVDAACLVRRTTRPLLEAMLDRSCDESFLEEFAELPFVDLTEEGLAIHDTVRQALSARLRSLDPSRHAELKRRAWSVLEAMLTHASPTGPHAWRLTADVLFVVEHAQIREAFFPSRESALSVDAATSDDDEAILAIAARHEPEATTTIFAHWLRDARSAVRVARAPDGKVLGFAIVTAAHRVPESVARADPLASAWLRDVAAGPGRERGALFVRRILSEGEGESASDVRAAFWLDAKRAYVERPAQWAMYAGTRRTELLPLLTRLGFRRHPIEHEGEITLLLEFGAAGIWSWLRGLVQEESRAGGVPGRGFHLDPAARGLVVDGQSLPLSPLEYGVFSCLTEAAGSVVTRDELLDRVWNQRHTGSNVVDAVVRLLRKKLGPYSQELETVKGHGYRLALR